MVILLLVMNNENSPPRKKKKKKPPDTCVRRLVEKMRCTVFALHWYNKNLYGLLV